MKRLILIIKIFLVILIVGIVGIVIFIKTLDMNRFKDQIARQISASINREVTLGRVACNFSFRQGVTLEISGLSIADDAEFSTEPLFYIDSAFLNVEIIPLLSQGQILVSKIELDSPKINIVRSKSGELNIERLAKSSSRGDLSGVSQTGQPASPNGSTDKKPADSVDGENEKEFDFENALVRSIDISDGTLNYIDRAIEPEMVIALQQFTLQVTNLSMSAPFPFESGASLWSTKQNIQIHGIAQINPKTKRLRIDDLIVDSDLKDLSLEQVYQGFPAAREMGLGERVGGVLKISVSQLILGEEGLLVLSSQGQLTDGDFSIKDFPIPLTGLNMEFEVSEADLEVKTMTLPISGGVLKVNGRILDYLTEQKFIGAFDIQNIDLDVLMSQLNAPAKVVGVLVGSIKGEGKGLSRDDLEANFQGGGSIEILEGRIVDVNILRLVLSKISFIPNLVQTIEANLPDRYKAKLGEEDTVLEKVKVDLKIHSNAVNIDQAEVNADGFVVIAQGKLDYDQNLNLKADFFVPEDLSANMVASAQDLSYLLNEQKQIHVPFKPYEGKLANFRMFPDIEDIGKKALMNRGREELQKVIFKALDLEGQQPQPSSSPGTESGSQTEPQQQEIRPEEAIIQDILNSIPIFNE